MYSQNENPFREFASDYDQWYETHRAAYLSELEAVKRLLPPVSRGLEIGVGTARFAEPLGIKLGVDPVGEMLRLARSRGVGVVQGCGEALPFAGGVFDCVLLIVTLCFVPEPERVMDEARRVLCEGGSVIIGIVDRESFLGRSYETRRKKSKFYRSVRFFSVPELLNLLPEHEWREIEIVQTLFDPPEQMVKVQNPEAGYGQGGFVVVRGKKY